MRLYLSVMFAFVGLGFIFLRFAFGPPTDPELWRTVVFGFLLAGIALRP